jgi:glycosyltransferase involved in cell wall biosynthesis
MRNAAQTVLEQVAALAHQSPSEVPFEVIWVDNGSDDETQQLVAEAVRGDRRMRVISAPEVESSYFARNRGVALARADLVLFCDADDVVDEHWVHSMTLALREFDVVGGAVKREVEEEAAVLAEPVHHFLPAAPTANLGIRKSAFEALGGFNSLIRSGEDWALCWRAQVHGFRFGFEPDAVVLYRRRGTDWTRMKKIWMNGRWYRHWASPFVALGADAPTIHAALKRIVDEAVLPAVKHPRRDHARIALWNLAVISSRIVKPKPPSA